MSKHKREDFTIGVVCSYEPFNNTPFVVTMRDTDNKDDELTMKWFKDIESATEYIRSKCEDV